MLLAEREGPVVWLTLNRPEKRNALNRELRSRLLEELRRAEEDQQVRVVVIRGAGGNFCAGADLSEFVELDGLGIREYNRAWGTQVIASTIQNMRKVVVAAVDGYCLGGGFELALACDIIVASKRAVFGLPELRVGLIPGGGGTQRLTRAAGAHFAKNVILRSRLFSAEEAWRAGIVAELAEPDKLEEVVRGVISDLLERSPVHLQAAKMAINAALETPLSQGLAYERELFQFVWSTEDRLEGMKAFLEKRKPEFRGR
ncbi:MAG: enoyl-CoA hydratase/isomerase family protein [Candidatus Caldarchaeales archaeon]